MYKRQLQNLRRKKGKKTIAEQSRVDEMTSLLDKFNMGENSAQTICRKIEAHETATIEGGSPAKRRRSSKSSSGQQAQLLKASRTYHYTLTASIRTRRHSDGASAQSCSRRVLQTLLSHTIDLDIENCMFTICWQIVEKIGVVLPLNLGQVLKDCAQKRDIMITNHLDVDRETGKHVLTAVMNGGGLTSRWADNPFLKQLQQLARFMRWLSCSLLPDVYHHCREIEHRKFPEASTFFFMWSAVEDQILAAWTDFVMELQVTHLSLHWDGIRLQADLPCDTEEFCNRCSDYIHMKTGFLVNIREKKHFYFRDFIAARCESVEDARVADDTLLQNGNCIPCALSHCLDEAGEFVTSVCDATSASNVSALRR